MADFSITPAVKVDDRFVMMNLAELKARGVNMRPVLSTIGEIILSSTEDNFREEGRYSTPTSWRGGSNQWRQLSKRTIKRREKMGKGAHPILQVRGHLAARFSSRVTNTTVTVGTNATQAHALHYGFDGMVTVKTHTRKSTKGKEYTVNSFRRRMYLPPRPIIAIQDVDIREINETIRDHILRDIPHS